jgi:hypothetical protein
MKSINDIATTWLARADAIRTLPLYQAEQSVHEFSTYIAAAFSKGQETPMTPDRLRELLAHLQGASDALAPLLERLEAGEAADFPPSRAPEVLNRNRRRV